MRGHQPQRLLGEAGAATHTGAEEVQSGGFGAACGPLGLAEGLEGLLSHTDPREAELYLDGSEENCPACPRVLGRAWGAREVKGISCPRGCNGHLVVSLLQSVFCNIDFVH